MSHNFDPYYQWLGIPPEDQPPHHYRLLGLKAFESNPDVIESAADRQMSHVKTHTTGKHSALSQKLLNELSAAKVCLLNNKQKLAYDERLRGSLAPKPGAGPVLRKASPLPIAIPQVSNAEAPRIVPANSRSTKPAWQQAAPWVSLPLLILLVAIWFMVRQEEPPAEAPIVSRTAPATPTIAPAEPVVTPPTPTIPREVAEDVPSPIAIKPPASPVEPVPTVKSTETDEPLPSTPVISTSAATASLSWTKGAVLALNFDAATAFERDGKKWSRDLSGKDNHGLMHGVASVDGKAGEAVRITAKEQYVECADSDSLIPADGLTLTAWINADSWHKGILAVICKSSGREGTRKVTQGYELRCPESGRSSFVVGTSTFKVIDSPDRISDKSWHHLVATYDRSKLRLYVDGSQVAEAAHEQPVTRTTRPLRIGAHSYLEDRTFTGQIDEVAIWNRSLSAEEVRELYAYSREGNSYCLAIGAASKAVPETAVARPAEVASTPSSPPGTLADLLHPGGRVDPEKLLPQPDGAALTAAEATIDQTYKADLAAAKAAPEKRAIAQKLYDAGVTTQNDPAGMFALLERGASLAAEAGDYHLARDALDALGKRFAVDCLVRKEAALTTAARSAKAADFARVAESWKSLADDAVMLDRYEEAKRFLQQATLAARRTTNKPLVTQIVEAGKDLDAIQAAYASTAEAQATLQKSPQDPAASAAWGRFLCLYKNDWEAGLTILAAGQQSPFAELARQDLAQPASPPEQQQLANGWWQAATTEDQTVPQKWLKARAAVWYRRALPALSGLNRDLAKKRIDESAQLVSPFPRGQWVDVLGMVDLSRHRVQGEWTRRGVELGSTKGPASRVMLPVLLDGTYDLELRYTPSKSVGAVLPVGERQCALVVGTSDGAKTGLESVPNSDVGHAKIPTGQAHMLEIRVQTVGGQATIDATVDSVKVFHWQGAIAALSLKLDRQLPHNSAPALLAFDHATVFHSVRLRLNTGTARLADE